MKKLFKMMSLIAAVIFGSMAMYSCTTEDDDLGGDDDGPHIKGPKWVLVDIKTPTITAEDFRKQNECTIYDRDSVEMVATKKNFSGYYSETVEDYGGSWSNGHYLFRFEISEIPQELEGGGKITLYSKISLSDDCYWGYDDGNRNVEFYYYHCRCYIDCRIGENKIRVPEKDWDKCGGYNLPIVIANENEPDIFKSEASIIGDVPMGKEAGERIELTMESTHCVWDKYIEATYTYEWRE